MSVMALVFCVIALGIGVVVGWVVASARQATAAQQAIRERDVLAGRAIAERDMARQERAKAEAALALLQARVEEAQKAEAAADARVLEAHKLLANHAELRKQIEDSFVALAQKAVKDASESLVHTNRTQIGGALDTKKAEIEALLTPVREMIESYRGELSKSELARNESYGGLQEQVKMLLIAQAASQKESSRLANALQSPTVRGSWG
ncbi:MAG: recombination protein RmuC, partial [Acidobacteriota bacterium]|nr:recombination protein RmuC [Acidobacteriota bacterium]